MVSKAISDAALRGSLALPRTAFPMRMQAAVRERQHVERLTNELYRRQAAARRDAPPYVLHDGPPYANGSLHMGHFMNKVLKDMLSRHALARGARVVYVPGWDCHGLPIETKALAGLRVPRDQLSPQDIRRAARACATAAIAEQAADFQRWGVLADFEVDARAARGNVYVTMDKEYEARQLRVFKTLVERGFVHRDLKPVYWSPSSTTALAEAELEYNDAHVSQAAWVAFAAAPHTPLAARHAHLHAVVWTTTPWTLPANVAIAVAPALEYVVLRSDRGSHYIVARSRAAAFAAAVPGTAFTEVAAYAGAALAGGEYVNPLAAVLPPAAHGRPRTATVITGSHVADDAGSGLVHTAPGHGHDDFDAVAAYNAAADATRAPRLPVLCPVDGKGRFTAEAGAALAGGDVLAGGTEAVLAALRAAGALLAHAPHSHRYPYDWRTKKPVIIRATQQWFVRVGSLVDRCRELLGGVTMVPPASRNRLHSMLGSRTEWCISRQRVWGVPIPALFERATGAALMTPALVEHIAGVVEAHGTDAWWTHPVADFLPPAATPAGTTAADYDKGTDTLDVWFDSGTSWAAAWHPQLAVHPPADAVVEGSDQHRGWFQSSLLTAAAAMDAAPYRAVVTHGFVLDEQLRKMSKSLGNVIAPADIIDGKASPPPAAAAAAGKGAVKGGGKGAAAAAASGKGAAAAASGHGADVLRYWAASADYTKDVAIGNNVVATVAENVRKVRNSARFLLANLYDYDVRGAPRDAPLNLNDRLLAAWCAPPAAALATPASLPVLERCMLHRLAAFDAEVDDAFRSAAFMRATSAINAFVAADLSSQYFDFSKDRLYAGAVAAPPRRHCQAVMWEALRRLTRAISPILVYSAESVYQHSAELLAPWAPAPGTPATPAAVAEVAVPSTVYDVTWAPLPAAWTAPALERTWAAILGVRGEVNRVLEAARAAKCIGSSNEAAVTVTVTAGGAAHDALRAVAADGQLHDMLLVSAVTVHAVDAAPAETPSVAMTAAGTPHFVAEGCGVLGGESPVLPTRERIAVRVSAAPGAKCRRCWKYSPAAAAHPAGVCDRCDAVLTAAAAWGT